MGQSFMARILLLAALSCLAQPLAFFARGNFVVSWDSSAVGFFERGDFDTSRYGSAVGCIVVPLADLHPLVPRRSS